MVTRRQTKYKDICDRFRETRNQAGLTQAEFARKLNISLSKVKAIETYIVAPDYGTVRKWSKIFKRSYDWIIDG